MKSISHPLSEGAIRSIYLESFYPIIADTDNPVIVTVKNGTETRSEIFQYVDGGEVFHYFWNRYFQDWLEFTTGDYPSFVKVIDGHIEVSIQSALLLAPPFPYMPESFPANPTLSITNGVLSFCIDGIEG